MRPLRTPATQGFIAMVMLVLFTLILGSLTIVARTSSGREASATQGRNREARDVAEAALTEIISELNKEANRKILVAGVALASWSQGTADLSNPLVNPCTRYDSNGAAATVVTPTAKAINFKNGWQNLIPGDNRRSFRLVSVTTTDAARNPLASPPPTNVSSGLVKTLVRLTVEGRVSNAAGTVISTTRVVKEYEVVPKCCKRSFGRNSTAATNFGEDNRFCYSGGGVQTASDVVAGVVGSLNGGVIDSSNNTLSIVDGTWNSITNSYNPVTRVLCRSNVPSPAVTNPDCLNRLMKLGSSISAVPSLFSIDVPPWPTASPPGFTEIKSESSNGLYVRINANQVEKCIPSSSGAIVSCEPVSACTYVSGLANYLSGHYCRFSSVFAEKGDIFFDTSSGPMFIYFDTPGSPRTSGNYVSYKGNQNVLQVSCATPPTGTARCNTIAGFADIEKLNLYAYGSGAMQLKGADAAVTMNVFAPKAAFTINGGGSVPFNFIGRLWVNNIYANGSTTMQVLESAPAQLVAQGVCTVSICTGIGTGANSSGSPEVDWVARSVTYSSAF